MPAPTLPALPVLPPPIENFPNVWTDSGGREWRLTLRIREARTLREAGLDILAPARLNAILNDEALQLDALWHLLREQAKAAHVLTKDALDEALTAEPSDYPQAGAALLGRLAVFFHSLARYRAARLLSKAREKILANQPPEPTPQEILAAVADSLPDDLARGALEWLKTAAQQQTDQPNPPPTPG